MNIILFSSSTNKSGGTRQALYLAQGLVANGHKVTFFLPQASTLPSIAPDFAHFTFLGAKNTWRTSIKEALPQDGSPFVLHAFHNAAVKKAALWGLLWKKNSVTVAHRGVLFRPKNPLPYWTPGIDRFVVNSTACEQVLHSIGLRKKRLCVVPNAVPDERLIPLQSKESVREALHLGDQHFVFGIVANNNPIKGVRQAITAFARHVAYKTACAHARLLIVGIRPELWLPLCEQLEVADKVLLIPPTEDVASYYTAMDSFVLPSLSESMPNTLLEAIRMHLPSIGTKVGAVPHIIDTCGICVPPNDVSSLGGAMVRMMTDAKLRTKFIEATRHEAPKYTPKVRVDSIEQIYRELLQRRGLSDA